MLTPEEIAKLELWRKEKKEKGLKPHGKSGTGGIGTYAEDFTIEERIAISKALQEEYARKNDLSSDGAPSE